MVKLHANTFFDDIREFHEKFGLAYDGAPRSLPLELQDFRDKFILEELEEYHGATMALGVITTTPAEADDAAEITHQLEHALDGLVDLVYVVLGSAYLHGFDFNEAWRRVHAANMAKVRAERAEQSARGSTFDVVKPEGWTAPDHKDLVENHAHL